MCMHIDSAYDIIIWTYSIQSVLIDSSRYVDIPVAETIRVVFSVQSTKVCSKNVSHMKTKGVK